MLATIPGAAPLSSNLFFSASIAGSASHASLHPVPTPLSAPLNPVAYPCSCSSHLVTSRRPPRDRAASNSISPSCRSPFVFASQPHNQPSPSVRQSPLSLRSRLSGGPSSMHPRVPQVASLHLHAEPIQPKESQQDSVGLGPGPVSESETRNQDSSDPPCSCSERMAPLSATHSADCPTLSASGPPPADGAASESVPGINDDLLVHKGSSLPKSAPTFSAISYLPPRRSAASASQTSVSTKPSPPATDASLSGSPRSDSMAPGAIDYSHLPSDLDPSRLPRHVAIILDGNSRWATRRGLPKMMGHDAGVNSVRETVRLCGEWGIRALTVFAFSTENWGRPQEEVDFIMGLLATLFDNELDDLHRNRVAVRVIGDRSRLSPELQRKIEAAHVRTQNNDGLRYSIAMSYSGRLDIVQACRRVAERVSAGELQPDQISEATLEQELSTSWLGPDLANPDLLIRTSGELRLSNFLMWQSAYTELYFCDTLWPDFGAPHLHAAILDYQQRDRRFGRRKESS